MEFETVLNAISTVGFPIAACCVMFYQNNKLQQTLADISNTMTTLTERLSRIEQAVEKED